MKTAVTRNILTGALAAGILLASPLAASAAAPASVPSIAQYDGTSIPSAAADLTMKASIIDQTPVYGEPGSTLNFSVPAKWPAGGTMVSAPFTASDDTWVAVSVPVDAKGHAFTKSTFAEAGVGYIHAGSVVDAAPAKAPNAVNPVQPSSQPTAPGPSQAATPSPTATPTASATAAVTAEPTATATPAAVATEPTSARASSNSAEPNWVASITSLVFGGLVIFPLYKLKGAGA